MRNLSLSAHALHEKAKGLALDFRRLESSLAQCLAEVDEIRLYFELGFPSLFQYATQALGLTESVAYALITVARTMKQVPELRAEIESGGLSVFKGKKICSVLIKAQADAEQSHGEQPDPGSGQEKQVQDVQDVQAHNREWIDKAKSMSSKKLEQEVKQAMLSPEERKERRIRVELKLSPEQYARWERCQALASASLGRAASVEEALHLLTSYYLDRQDPLEKAKRASARKAKKEGQAQTQAAEEDQQVSRTVAEETLEVGPSIATRRPLIPASLLHEVNLRDQKRCQYPSDKIGHVCGEIRFTEIHHVKPLSQGGLNEFDNLTTTCSGHHRMIHWQMVNQREKPMWQP